MLQHISEAIDYIPLPMLLLDINIDVLKFNKRFINLLVENDFMVEFSNLIKNLKQKIVSNNFLLDSVYEIESNNHIFIFDLSAIVDKEEAVGYLCIISDITKLRLDEEQLNIYSKLIEQAPISIIITDINGNIEYGNNYVLNVSGYTKEEIIGKNPKIFKSKMTPKKVYDELWETITSGKVWNGRLINKKKDDSIFIENVIIAPLRNKEGNVINYIGFKEDITDKIRLEEKIIYDESHDLLTGLYNRHEFEMRTMFAINDIKQYNTCYCVAIINIDDFKVINDVIGYNAGDDLLIEFSKFLKNCFPDVPTISRLGSDEFGLLFVNETEKGVVNICDNFRKKVIDWNFIWNDTPFKITVSIGISVLDKEKTVSSFLSNADSACSEAKTTGKNRIKVYKDVSEFNKRKKQQEIFLKLKDQLKNDELVLFLQKIIPKEKSNKIHYEILMRIKDGDKLISPISFLEVAENFQIVFDVDMWVIRKVFHFINSIKKIQNIDNIFTINLSSRTLSDIRCLDTIINLIAEYNIDPTTIGFEITETAAIINFDVAQILIKKLRDIGCLILLDDFGSGMSSFSRLHSIPIDIIKIDGCFIRNINEDSFSQSIVKGIVGIVESIKAKTVAEFVHNKEVYKKCISLGVDYFQGYYIQKPLPICSIFCEKIKCIENTENMTVLESCEKYRYYKNFEKLDYDKINIYLTH